MQACPAYIVMCELNHTKRKLEFIVIFVRDLKAAAVQVDGSILSSLVA